MSLNTKQSPFSRSVKWAVPGFEYVLLFNSFPFFILIVSFVLPLFLLPFFVRFPSLGYVPYPTQLCLTARSFFPLLPVYLVVFVSSCPELHIWVILCVLTFCSLFPFYLLIFMPWVLFAWFLTLGCMKTARAALPLCTAAPLCPLTCEFLTGCKIFWQILVECIRWVTHILQRSGFDWVASWKHFLMKEKHPS